MKNDPNIKTKNTIGIAIIYAIVIVVFNIIVFVVFQNRSSVFWLSYAFMMVAFAVQIISMALAFKTADIQAAFFGIPLASFSVYYLCAALVVGLLFMIFQGAGVTLALVIQLIVLTIFVVIAIISIMARDTVVEVSNDIKNKVVDLKSVQVDVELMASSCGDPELKAALQKLTDTVRYSDPMTNESVADLEKLSRDKVSELKFYLNENNLAEAKRTCAQLEQRFLERNRKLAISK